MDRIQKQNIINSVTDEFKRRQWFNGCGFEGDRLVIAYNFYPAFELVDFKSSMMKYGVEYDLKDIRVVVPGSRKDDIPDYMKH
jgi:hypothetical protein